MKLLDREKEREALRRYLFSPRMAGVGVLQIEGAAGVGKSDLLRYAAMSGGDDAFAFEDGRRVLACRGSDRPGHFSALTPLIGELARRHGRSFGVGMDEVAGVATAPLSRIVSSVAIGAPYLRGATQAFQADLQETTAAKASLLQLARESLQTGALTTFLAKTLRSDASDRLILAIDDIHLADELSVRTLFAALRRLARNECDVRVLATTAAQPQAPESRVTRTFEDVLRDYPEIRVEYLFLENLGRGETAAILAEAGRVLTAAESDYVYHVSEGNFSGIARLLRQSDERLRLMYRNWLTDRELDRIDHDPLLTRNHLRGVFDTWPHLRTCFMVLSALENEVTVDELRLIWPALESNDKVASPLSRGMVEERLQPAVSSGDLQMVGHHVIAERRALEAARSLFLRDGSHSRFARLFADLLFALARDNKPVVRPVSRAIRILGEFNPVTALEALETWWKEPGRPDGGVPLDVLETGAALICGPAVRRAPERWVALAVELLLGLRRARRFHQGADVGAFVAGRLSSVELGNGFRTLEAIVVCLREAGRLPTADVVGVLNSLKALASSDDEKVDALLLGATVWEHLADFEQAASSVTEAEVLLSGAAETADPLVQAKVARHLGLRDFHGDVIQNCLAALHRLPPDGADLEARMSRASLHNHIGLGYYHTGKLTEADAYFRQCLDELESIGFRTETPLNNLGACMIMVDDLSEAMSLLETARDLPTKPTYQALSIDINYGLCLFKLGNHELALSVLSPIADGTRPAPDPYLRSQAQCTLAYCYLQLGSFAQAAGLYAESSRCRFRFLAHQQASVRRLMARYCAARAGIIEGEDLGDLSVVDLAEKQPVPVRRPYQLDLNSLYVV